MLFFNIKVIGSFLFFRLNLNSTKSILACCLALQRNKSLNYIKNLDSLSYFSVPKWISNSTAHLPKNKLN